MIQEKFTQALNLEPGEAGWNSLYRIAGIGVLLSVALILLDIALSFTGGDMPVGKMTAVDWFAHLHSRPFIGLRNLGLFNVINPLLTLPLYLALYHTHRKSSPAYAALALILLLLCSGIYVANNRALSMLALSQQYAAATSDAQKSLLTGAGTVILAQAEDFTPGTFIGLFLPNLASLLMLAVMLRGKVFSRWIVWLGLVGASLMLIFTISATFAPALFNLVMLFALSGGLMMLAWDIFMALGMFRLARTPLNEMKKASPGAELHPSQKEAVTP